MPLGIVGGAVIEPMDVALLVVAFLSIYLSIYCEANLFIELPRGCVIEIIAVVNFTIF